MEGRRNRKKIIGMLKGRKKRKEEGKDIQERKKKRKIVGIL